MRRSEWFVLLLVGILIGVYFVVTILKPNIREKRDCSSVVDSLNNVNDSLALRVIELNNEVDLYELKVDSLQKVKNKVIIEYISLYDEIDSADATDITNMFKVVFTKYLGK